MTNPDISLIPPVGDQNVMADGWKYRKMVASNTWHRNMMILGLGICGTLVFISTLAFVAFRQWQAGNVREFEIMKEESVTLQNGELRRDSARFERAERKAERLRMERERKGKSEHH